jgi:hypothetical protein
MKIWQHSSEIAANTLKIQKKHSFYWLFLKLRLTMSWFHFTGR